MHEKAISTKNEKTIFYDESDICVVGQGGSVVQWDTNFDYHASQKRSGYEVQMIDFADFVKELVAKHGKINFVKLDIEGAEFEVLDALLEQNLHENIEYLMVETHERIFDNPKAKIQALKDKIKAKNITNIYLDWI